MLNALNQPAGEMIGKIDDRDNQSGDSNQLCQRDSQSKIDFPAMIVVDAVARQIPGVLGKEESIEEKWIASGEVYTRPEIFEFKKKKHRVPKVLLSGDHKKIIEWRKKRGAPHI